MYNYVHHFKKGHCHMIQSYISDSKRPRIGFKKIETIRDLMVKIDMTFRKTIAISAKCTYSCGHCSVRQLTHNDDIFKLCM